MNDEQRNAAELFEARLDEWTLPLLMPLRTDKSVNEQALTAVIELMNEASASGLFAASIPTRVAGKAWFLFIQMISEADHTRDPEPILAAAWRYVSALQTLFGPHF